MSVSIRHRWKVLVRDNFTCRYCGQSAPDVVLEVDHIEPVSRGGSDEFVNLVTACWDCNRGKTADDASEPLSFMGWIDSLRADVALLDMWVDSLRHERSELDLELEDARAKIEYLQYALASAEANYTSQPTHIRDLLTRRAS